MSASLGSFLWDSERSKQKQSAERGPNAPRGARAAQNHCFLIFEIPYFVEFDPVGNYVFCNAFNSILKVSALFWCSWTIYCTLDRLFQTVLTINILNFHVFSNASFRCKGKCFAPYLLCAAARRNASKLMPDGRTNSPAASKTIIFSYSKFPILSNPTRLKITFFCNAFNSILKVSALLWCSWTIYCTSERLFQTVLTINILNFRDFSTPVFAVRKSASHHICFAQLRAEMP